MMAPCAPVLHVYDRAPIACKFKGDPGHTASGAEISIVEAGPVKTEYVCCAVQLAVVPVTVYTTAAVGVNEVVGELLPLVQM